MLRCVLHFSLEDEEVVDNRPALMRTLLLIRINSCSICLNGFVGYLARGNCDLDQVVSRFSVGKVRPLLFPIG